MDRWIIAGGMGVLITLPSLSLCAFCFYQVGVNPPWDAIAILAGSFFGYLGIGSGMMIATQFT